VKGFEYSRGKYVTFEPEELDEVRMPQRHTLDMVQFVDIDEIDPIYFDRPYFVTPDGQGAAEPFAVVRDALKNARKAGLGEIVFAGKEHLVAVRACGKGMLLETLRYAEEVRTSDAYFEEIGQVKVDDDQLSLAKELIQRKSGPFQPEKFHDTYAETVKDMIKAKAGGEALAHEEDIPAGNVINLMDALKRSVAESGKADIAPRPRKKAATEKKPATKKRKAG
jgi:DNA end-binding protein Ku